MSSFTPRAWKSQAAPEAEHRAEAPVEPPQSSDVVACNNLPVARTAFIGRERDVAHVKERLSHHRLVTLVGSGGVALSDVNGARDSAREGLRAARNVRHEQSIAIMLQHLAVLAALGDEARRGARLLGYVDAQYAALGLQRESTELWGYDKLMAALREALSADEIAKLGVEGAAWTEDQAVEEALKA